MKKLFFSISFIIPCLLLAGTITVSPALAESQNAVNDTQGIQKIALIPFTMNGKQHQKYLQNGMLQMLRSRLNWPGHVQVISEARIQQILSKAKGNTQQDTAGNIARQTGSRFVLTGSLTCLGDSFSVDAKLFDMKKQRYMPFFDQSDNPDDFIVKIDRLAAMINKEAFSRTTITWDAMYKEQKTSVNENRRRNPEYLMQNPAWQQTKKSNGWKFWKNLF